MMMPMGIHEVQISALYALLLQLDKHADPVESCSPLHQVATATMQTVSVTQSSVLNRLHMYKLQRCRQLQFSQLEG